VDFDNYAGYMAHRSLIMYTFARATPAEFQTFSKNLNRSSYIEPKLREDDSKT